MSGSGAAGREARRRERWAGVATALSLAPVVWMYGHSSGAWALALPLELALLGAVLVPRKLSASAEVRTLSAAASIVVGVAGTLAVPPVRMPGQPEAMSELLAGTALMALVLAVLRTWTLRPRWGHGASVGVGLLALVSCGAVPQLPGAFPWAMALALGAGAVAVELGDATRPAAWRRGARHGLGALVVVGGATAFTFGMALALPQLQREVEERWFEHVLARQNGSRTGFDVRFQLGGLTSMLQSDAVALRVLGPEEARPALLRGVVYGRYQLGGHWFLPHLGEAEVVSVPGRAPAGDDVVEVQNATGEATVFVATDARAVATPDGELRVDASGMLRPASEDPVGRVWYRPGRRERFAPAPPLRDDLRLPSALEAPLGRIVEEWTVPGSSPERRLETIAARLARDYRYSLRSEHPVGHDPTLDFLTRNPSGHCEYFASAMALLARAAGIPARVVGGYRVHEVNPIGGYAVVRDRDAHAWVEAWVEGKGWLSYDPTPGAALTEGRVAETPSARWDLLAARWWRLREAVDLRVLTMAVLGAVLAFLVVRDLWRRRRERTAAEAAATPGDRPLPCYEELALRLARHGLERAPGETLHRFARRVAEAPLGEDRGEALAEWLEGYAALRYGGRGDAAELTERLRPLLEEPPPVA